MNISIEEASKVTASPAREHIASDIQQWSDYANELQQQLDQARRKLAEIRTESAAKDDLIFWQSRLLEQRNEQLAEKERIIADIAAAPNGGRD